MAPIKILHISDTHFGSHDERKSDALFRFIRIWHPDIVVLTGDILDSPMPWQSSYFDKAKIFLETMRLSCHSVHCIPGNHDALLGSLCLKRFWRKLQMGSTSFVEYTNVGGQGVCLIGVDTTHLYIPHFNNSGYFDNVMESELDNEFSRLRNEVDLDRAIKVALVHHHPIPTITAAKEKMLYFKNSGLFLRFAVRHRVRLILHGHQHDPHFSKISFGSDHDDDSIGVLSAGSCIKADTGEPEISGCGHFYTVAIDPVRALATSYFYHRTVRRFIATDEFLVSRITTSDPRMVILDHFFHVTNTGGMKAREARTYERTTDGACVAVISIGVDDESDDCPGATLRLAVMVDGTPGRFSLVEDQPRSKRIRVTVGEGPHGARFTVEIEYTWPGGFRRLLKAGKDHGEFVIRSKGTERYTLTLELEDGYHRQLEPLDVFYVDRDQIERPGGNGSRQSFTIRHPRANSRISWTATMSTAADARH